MFNKTALLLLLIQSLSVFATNIDESMTGSWFDQTNPGQGLNIEVLSENKILVYWYTYDNGRPIWLTGLGNYQGDTAEIELSQFEGGQFGVSHKSDLVTSKIFGTLSISFDSCNTGVMTYSSTEGLGNGSINLNRLTSVPGIPCTTPVTPFNQNAIDKNGLRFDPGTCRLQGNLLTCEFTVTSLNADAKVRLFGGGGITNDGITYRVKSTHLGSGVFASSESLTEGIPVTGTITYDGIPESTRMVDLIKIRFQKSDNLFDIDFFDAIIVNEN